MEATAANWFSRITKGQIVEAVAEGAARAMAERIVGLKKAEMATEAERLLRLTGWLPPMLRTKGRAAFTPIEGEGEHSAEGEAEALASEDATEDLAVAAE